MIATFPLIVSDEFLFGRGGCGGGDGRIRPISVGAPIESNVVAVLPRGDIIRTGISHWPLRFPSSFTLSVRR